MKYRQILYVGFLKTLWFNFRYLPFKEAIHFPVLLSRDVQIRKCYRGFCSFVGEVNFVTLRIGFGDRLGNVDQKSSIAISGKLIVEGNGVHAFGPGIRLGIGKHGVLKIGNNFTSSVNNRIICCNSITIGNDNMWSFDNVVMDSDVHQIMSNEGKLLNRNGNIEFGNHVWLGCRNIVTKGTVIPNGCVVASGSKLSRQYEKENCIITSHGKIIKENINWKRDWAV
jgi:acetyltransferase-like isoleucine patch superfamily enzyme